MNFVSNLEENVPTARQIYVHIIIKNKYTLIIDM